MSLQIKLDELESQIAIVTAERDMLKDALAKMGSLGDEEKETLIKRLLDKHPDCFQDLELGNAFDEAAKKLDV